MSKDRSAIATAARQYMDELGAGFVTGTILVAAIDRAARRLNADTGFNRGDVSVGLTAGNREVSVGGTVTDVHRVRIGTGSARKRLLPTDMSELDRRDAAWEAAAAGVPTQYYFDGLKIGFVPKPPVAAMWATSTRYTVGSYVSPRTDNAHIYKCQTAGTTGAAQPTWPTTAGSHVADNLAAWAEAGASKVYVRCVQTPTPLANATTVPSWCPVQYQDTIPKRTALDLVQGLGAENSVNWSRYEALYKEYLQESAELRALATKRSVERVGQITPKGYSSFRR